MRHTPHAHAHAAHAHANAHAHAQAQASVMILHSAVALSLAALHSRSICQSSLCALCLSLSLSVSLFLSLRGPQHNISHIVASRVSTTAVVSTHDPITLPPSWRSSLVDETASQHFCFTHRIVLVTWRALLSLSFLSETPKQSPSRNCPSRRRS